MWPCVLHDDPPKFISAPMQVQVRIPEIYPYTCLFLKNEYHWYCQIFVDNNRFRLNKFHRRGIAATHAELSSHRRRRYTTQHKSFSYISRPVFDIPLYVRAPAPYYSCIVKFHSKILFKKNLQILENFNRTPEFIFHQMLFFFCRYTTIAYWSSDYNNALMFFFIEICPLYVYSCFFRYLTNWTPMSYFTRWYIFLLL